MKHRNILVNEIHRFGNMWVKSIVIFISSVLILSSLGFLEMSGTQSPPLVFKCIYITVSCLITYLILPSAIIKSKDQSIIKLGRKINYSKLKNHLGEQQFVECYKNKVGTILISDQWLLIRASESYFIPKSMVVKYDHVYKSGRSNYFCVTITLNNSETISIRVGAQSKHALEIVKFLRTVSLQNQLNNSLEGLWVN